jgi:hypothetical protein
VQWSTMYSADAPVQRSRNIARGELKRGFNRSDHELIRAGATKVIAAGVSGE